MYLFSRPLTDHTSFARRLLSSALVNIDSATDSHTVSAVAILERRQVQNDCLAFAELDAHDFASTLATTAGLCTLTTNEHLVGISVQQLKGSTRGSIR